MRLSRARRFLGRCFLPHLPVGDTLHLKTQRKLTERRHGNRV